MNSILKTFVLSGIVIIAITIALSGCKSGGETKSTETTIAADTALAEETLDTSKAIATRRPLTVVIQNLESATAPVYVSIYSIKSKFPSPKGQLKEYKFTPHGKELIAEMTDVKFGTYALATYQDVNSSGEIDKNFIGIPTEGFGFSNNYKPKVKAPNFSDCCFAYNAKTNSVTVKMIH